MMATQNHIHLSTTLSGAPENAPDITWKVREDGRQIIPNIVETHRRSLRGKLNKHRLRNSSGDILRFTDFKYIIRLSDYGGLTKEERWDALVAMQGEQVYLVDNIHANDGEDHTSDVRTMYLYIVSDIVQLDPLLNVEYATIELVDDSV